MPNLRKEIQNLLRSTSSNYSSIDKKIDQLLGLNHQKVEELARLTEIDHEQGYYLQDGIRAEALYTSYFDFLQIAKQLDPKEGQIFVDLGAGISRSKLLYDLLFPHTQTIAIEKSKARVEAASQAAKQLGTDQNLFINQDLMTCSIPEADFYFIYLPAGKLLNQILKKLEMIAIKREVKVIAIEAHGDLINNIRLNAPWLIKENSQIKTFIPRHDSNIYFFKSLSQKELKSWQTEKEELFEKLILQENIIFSEIPVKWRHLFLLYLSSRQDFDVLIQEENHSWLGSLYEWENSLRLNQYSFKYPPREVPFQKIKKILIPENKYQFWRSLRLQNKNYKNLGPVRKIIVSPEPQIEFGSGKRINLNELEATSQA